MWPQSSIVADQAASLFGFAEDEEEGRKIVPHDVTLQDVSITSCLVPPTVLREKF